MNNETRQRLIDSIVRHFYSADQKGLKVATVAKEAGITRQAMHRYYSDLMGYIKGDKDVGELLPGRATDSVSQLLIDTQKRAAELESQLATIESRHNHELKVALDSHITALMNNDATLFDTDEVRISLEKQNALIDDYSGQITALKAKLIKAQLSNGSNAPASPSGTRVSYDPDMLKALAAYKKKEDYDAYLDTKAKELTKIISKVNAFTGKTTIIFFLERFISDFSDFLSDLPPPQSNQIVIRLPLFTSLEVRNFVKKITTPGPKHIYIPDAPSRADATAQRAFRAFSVPEKELKHAERAEAVYLFKEVDQVVNFTAATGK